MKGSSRITHDSTSDPNEVPLVFAVICDAVFLQLVRNDCPACGGMAVV